VANEWENPPRTGLHERTPVRVSIASLVIIIGCLVSGGWYARDRLGAVESEVRSLSAVVGGLPGQLSALEARISLVVGDQLQDAILKCPRRAARGDAWMDCEVIFPRRPEKTGRQGRVLR
jgi:hypothetical protein